MHVNCKKSYSVGVDTYLQLGLLLFLRVCMFILSHASCSAILDTYGFHVVAPSTRSDEFPRTE
jgi:hypothetical protein